MKRRNITGQFKLLESLYIERLMDIISNLPQKKQMAVWQEVYSDHDNIRNDTIIHVWRNDFAGYWQDLIKNVSKSYHKIYCLRGVIRQLVFGCIPLHNTSTV